MARKRFRPEEIIHTLREAEVELAQGKKAPEVCKKLGVTEQIVLPLAEGVRGPEGGPGSQAEGPGEGKRPAEEAARGGGTRQGHSAGGRLGKLLSPAKRRQAVEHVRDALGRGEVSERSPR